MLYFDIATKINTFFGHMFKKKNDTLDGIGKRCLKKKTTTCYNGMTKYMEIKDIKYMNAQTVFTKIYH